MKRISSDSSGIFSSPERYYCGWYDVYCDHFSYLPFEDSLLIDAAGGYTFNMEQRPCGEFTGVTSPENIEILLNWSETDQNFYRTISEDGMFAIPEVTYQSYTLYAQRRGYKPYIHALEFSAATPPLEITLEPAAGEIMLVDNAMYWESPALIDSILNGLGY